MNPYQKPHRHRQIDSARMVDREKAVADLVGRPLIFHGPSELDTTSRRLYPDRTGRRCTLLAISSEKGPCPLIVEFGDGYRAIAEPEWLRPVERAEVAS